VRRLTRLLLGAWIRRLMTRGLLVTNIGPLDPWLAPLGEQVRDATFVGPSVRPMPIPVLTATGFRDGLTIHFNGYEETALELERLAGELRSIFGESERAIGRPTEKKGREDRYDPSRVRRNRW
jgi:NRPS condensation-like uncharacterized protein